MRMSFISSKVAYEFNICTFTSLRWPVASPILKSGEFCPDTPVANRVFLPLVG
jgi:hypothetical protein